MHETRMLALGGSLRPAPVGAYQTDVYFRRVMFGAFLFAVVASTMLSILPDRHPNPAAPGDKLRGAPVDPIWIPSPPSISRSAGPLPRIRLPHPRPVPVPDARLQEPVADAFEQTSVSGGTSSGDAGDEGEAIDGQGPDWGWVPPRSEAAQVFLFAELPPQLVSLEIPAYPELAREAGVEGIVHVEVLVGEDGLVLDAVVKEGLPLLDEAALAAAFSAVFRPAQQSGRPVRTRVVVPIEFSLRR